MIPLCVRSHYSLMWGVDTVKAICRAAARMGYEQLALTDTDNLYGLWTFIDACDREGIRPIIGAELTDPKSKQRIVCLVENETGYSNLCRLLTRRHGEAAFDVRETVVDCAQGLLFLVADVELLKVWYEADVWVAAHMPRRPLSQRHPLCRMARRLYVPMVATPSSFFLKAADISIHRLLRAIDTNTSLYV